MCVGGGLVVPERLRCDPPFLHEGMTTDLQGERIGQRLQLVTDPDWFNVAENFSDATERALAAQKKIFTSLGNRESWVDVKETGAVAAQRMRKVAALCARVGLTNTAHGEPQWLCQRTPSAADPTRSSAASCPAAVQRCAGEWAAAAHPTSAYPSR